MKNYEELSKVHFDAQAAVYDSKDTIYYSKNPKISCADVLNRLNNVTFSKMLDIGCGTGYLIELLRREHGGVYFGIDLSPKMLNEAEKRLGDSVYLTEGSALSLPYDSGVFDVVTCVQSFHHYPDPQKAMAEASRVTAPGGLYIISDTGCSGFAKWISNHVVLKLSKGGDFASYDRADLEKMMKDAGFTIKESVSVTKMIYTVVAVKGNAV